MEYLQRSCRIVDLSGQEVERLLSFHIIIVNTTAYHPQTDGMLGLGSTVLFSYNYRASQQPTMHAPKNLLYGRDPWFPVEDILGGAMVDLKDEMATRIDVGGMGGVPKVHWANPKEAQVVLWSEQEATSIQRRRQCQPADKTGETHKFARPFHPWTLGGGH